VFGWLPLCRNRTCASSGGLVGFGVDFVEKRLVGGTALLEFGPVTAMGGSAAGRTGDRHEDLGRAIEGQ